jgi:L-arabinose isomerase
MGEDIQQRAKVGVFGIGLEAYWQQFEGLRDRLEGYQRSVEERIGRWATVVSPGLVDTAPKAYAAGEKFAEERVDLIFSTPLPTRRACRYSPRSRKQGSPSSSSTQNLPLGTWVN